MTQPRPMRLLASGVPLLLALLVATPALAQVDRTPDFATTVPAQWMTDRYEPDFFGLADGVFGRDDVLQIGIGDGDRAPGFQGMFYNTQGRKYALDGTGTVPPLSQMLQADLYVPESWASASNGLRRSDLWARIVPVNSDDESGAFYSILGFTNQDGAGLFRYWSSDIGWQNLAAPVVYGAWNTLQMGFDGNIFSAFVNGSGGALAAGSPGQTRLSTAFVQAYQFDESFGPNSDPTYTANWSNVTDSNVVPEPATTALLATGLVGLLVAYRRRERGQKQG